MRKLTLVALFLMELVLLAMIVSPVVHAESECPLQIAESNNEYYGRFVKVDMSLENVSEERVLAVMVCLIFVDDSNSVVGSDKFTRRCTSEPGGTIKAKSIRPIPSPATGMVVAALFVLCGNGELVECQ